MGTQDNEQTATTGRRTLLGAAVLGAGGVLGLSGRAAAAGGGHGGAGQGSGGHGGGLKSLPKPT
ncbi:hypothetical protein, partial [Streptomyces nigra]